MIIIQFYTVSQTSLAKTSSSIVEEYIPLWFADGTNIGNNPASLGSQFICDGGGVATVNTSPPARLFTLNSNWSNVQQFAFEASIYVDSGSTGSAALWDMTSNTLVGSSQVSTILSSYSVIRSGRFVLVPGHIYGVTFSTSNTSYFVRITDASLIIFGS